MVILLTTLTFLAIYHVHSEYIRIHKIEIYGIWDIPFQTFESLVEFRMINFFAPQVLSAKLMRGFYILFGAMMVMAYSSLLRSSLVAKDMGDKPIDSLEVS